MFVRSLWRALTRGWLWAAVAAAAVALGGALLIPGAPLTHSAEARVVIRDPQPDDADAILGDAVLRQALRQPELAGRFTLPRLRAALSVRRDKGSRVLRVACTDTSASRAVAGADGVAKAFETLQAGLRNQEAAAAVSDLERAIESRGREEAAVEAELARLPAAARGSAESGDAGRLAEMDRAIASGRAEAERLAARIDDAKRRLESGDAGPPGPVDSSESDRLRRELETERRALEELRALQPGTPAAARAEARVEDLRVRQAAAANREVLEARFAPVRRLLDQVRADGARREELLRAAPDLEARRADLARTVSPAPATPESSARRRLEARLEALVSSRRELEAKRARAAAEGERASRVERIEPAGAASVASAPIFAVLGVALLAGLAAAWVLDALSSLVRTDHDVRRYVNLPLLGTVPLTRAPEDRTIVRAPARAPLVEVFNSMATLLDCRAREGGVKMLSFTSASPGEGKSTVSCNLAVALARAGSRVLLVDADLRKSAQHRMLGVAGDTGLSTYLIGGTDDIASVIAPTDVENLSLLPAGPLLQSPGPYLRSERFKALLPDLKNGWDYVIVDLPPVRAVADGLLVGPLTDGVVLVLSAQETRKDDATVAKRLLRDARATLAGCVLNKSAFRSRGYYYYSAPAEADAAA